MKKIVNYSINAINKVILLQPFVYRRLAKPLHSLNNLPSSFIDYQNIYIDVSVYAKADNKTGIQRVIREVILQMLQDDKIKTKIRFVVATKKKSYRIIHYTYTDNTLNFDISSATTHAFINPTSKDLFFGLDFCPNIIPSHIITLLHWKLKGVAFAWVLYDVLPLHHPQWFTPNIQSNFESWLKAILLVADVTLCISNTVQQQAKKYATAFELTPKFTTIQLGHGFNTDNRYKITVPPPIPTEYVLMVGTLEPRKGHLEIIKAFENIWQTTQDNTALVLIGKKGWLVEDLITTISHSEYLNKKLFWFDNIEDNSLKTMYKNALGVIIASFDEGYGLPLIEALSFGQPVLARDIPIFHEIANSHPNVDFFRNTHDKLEYTLAWLDKIRNAKTNKNKATIPAISWQTTLEDIKNAVIQ